MARIAFILTFCAACGRDPSVSRLGDPENLAAPAGSEAVADSTAASGAAVRLGSAPEEPAEHDWDDFLRSPVYADLHNDRSFFLTARGIPWRNCSGVQLCSSTYGRSNSFFSLWRPPRPIGVGRPWGLSAKQARRLNAMSHFDYLKRAIADLKATGIPIENDSARIGSGRPAFFLGIEGAYLLNKSGRRTPDEDELKEILNFLRKEKVTYIALVWSNDNVYAGTSKQPAKGLTQKGRALVRLLIEYGFLIDLSHASDKTVLDFHTFTRGRYPLFFSHSSARALCSHARNLSNEMLALVRKTGGLVGVNFYTRYLSCKKRADITDIVAHIAHIHDKAGPEHIALGSDFDGLITLPDGLKKPAQLSDLARRLEARMGRQAVRQIFYGNVRKFLSEWRRAKKLEI